MKISVIMLTYNRERFICKAMESILSQTFHDFEFIIVDNGSTDESGVLADRYASHDNRVRVIHREWGTIGSGRNTGLEASHGDYIAFVDDDDWCEPDYLEFLLSLVETHQADISICGSYREENGQVTQTSIPDEVLTMNAEESIIQLMWRKRYNTGFPTKLISRRLFQQYRFSETSRYEDISLLYKILAEAGKVVSYGLPKYHVRRHKDNNSSATAKDNLITPEFLNAYRGAYRERTQWLCGKFPDNCKYWWYFNDSFLISMVNKIITSQLSDCNEHLAEMSRELYNRRAEFMKSPYILNFEKEWMEKYISASIPAFKKNIKNAKNKHENENRAAFHVYEKGGTNEISLSSSGIL